MSDVVWVDNKTYEKVLKNKEITVILESKGASPVLVKIIKEEDINNGN